jgi:hypothetical protein
MPLYDYLKGLKMERKHLRGIKEWETHWINERNV